MVLAFLCHSLAGSPCRILFSSVYGDDLQLQGEQAGSEENLRVVRKEQFLLLSCRVQAEYGFRESCKEQIPKLKEEYVNVGGSQDGCGLVVVLHSQTLDLTYTEMRVWKTDIESPEKGLFRLAAGDPFPTPKMVVWIARICEPDENYMQAESVLTTISKLVEEQVTSQEQENAEMMLKSEKMAVILGQFLPCGQILFLNHKVQAQLERQVEKLLTAK